MRYGKIALVVFLVLACLFGAVAPVHAAGDKTGQEYTDTLQRDCLLAVRADVYDGFTGIVEVSILDEYGEVTDCELTSENGYARNLQVAQGSYEVKRARAYTGETCYEVKRLASRIRVNAQEVAVCRLVVSDYVIPREETEETQTVGTEDTENKEENAMAKLSEDMQENTGKKKASMGRISVLLWLAALAGAGVYWYLHYGRKKRYGR